MFGQTLKSRDGSTMGGQMVMEARQTELDKLKMFDIFTMVGADAGVAEMRHGASMSPQGGKCTRSMAE